MGTTATLGSHAIEYFALELTQKKNYLHRVGTAKRDDYSPLRCKIKGKQKIIICEKSVDACRKSPNRFAPDECFLPFLATLQLDHKNFSTLTAWGQFDCLLRQKWISFSLKNLTGNWSQCRSVNIHLKWAIVLFKRTLYLFCYCFRYPLITMNTFFLVAIKWLSVQDNVWFTQI